MKKTIALAVIAYALGGSAYAAGNKDQQTTAVNKTASPTAQDQSNAAADVELTRKIRASIMEDKTLSVNAQNVKIITANGKVTLSGLVKNTAEKNKVESLAKNAAGTLPVESQLTISK